VQRCDDEGMARAGGTPLTWSSQVRVSTIPPMERRKQSSVGTAQIGFSAHLIPSRTGVLEFVALPIHEPAMEAASQSSTLCPDVV
jgi:hypothetical protein